MLFMNVKQLHHGHHQNQLIIIDTEPSWTLKGSLTKPVVWFSKAVGASISWPHFLFKLPLHFYELCSHSKPDPLLTWQEFLPAGRGEESQFDLWPLPVCLCVHTWREEWMLYLVSPIKFACYPKDDHDVGWIKQSHPDRLTDHHSLNKMQVETCCLLDQGVGISLTRRNFLVAAHTSPD